MRITSIEQVRFRPERVRVTLDGRRTVDLTREVAEEAGLRPGTFLDDLRLAKLLDRNVYQETLDRALHFLGTRPRSEREVRTRLTKAGATTELIDRVIERLRALGLIDDAAFARFWIENRERFSPRGARALKAELRLKGLANEVIATEIEDAVDEETGCREVALKHAPRLAKLDYKTFRQKMFAFLARRGFDFEAIGPAVEEAWQAVGGGEGEGEDAAGIDE
jgi:regulatory protein